MYEQKSLSTLYEIASHLNKEFSLAAALRKSLEKTVNALNLQTGWIWLVERDVKSVYLAASYNLPPALKDYPERLSGWCYCIDRYLSSKIDEATNVSEIACSRLKDLVVGTQDLRYHATIPIITSGQKVGLINLLSKEKQQLGEEQLAILNDISELIGTAIQRTRLQEVYVRSNLSGVASVHDALERLSTKRIEALLHALRPAALDKSISVSAYKNSMDQARQIALDLKEQVRSLLDETSESTDHFDEHRDLRYPSSPLTPREIEVLHLVKTGRTNARIAEQLYISERTVKFHMTSILSKLHAKTRTQAVDVALKRGLISGSHQE